MSTGWHDDGVAAAMDARSPRTHPSQMGVAEISRFLTFLAVDQHVSASTQNQALSAPLFLYRHVLAMSIGDIPPVVRARTPERLPVVLSRDGVGALLTQLTGRERLVVMLLYGAGLRLEECLEWRWQFVFPATRICRDPRWARRRGIACTSR